MWVCERLDVYKTIDSGAEKKRGKKKGKANLIAKTDYFNSLLDNASEKVSNRTNNTISVMLADSDPSPVESKFSLLLDQI